jgi:type II secretory ATPase GspE/PulE/Tfp pilus assembly ATPase PilB-like protein
MDSAVDKVIRENGSEREVKEAAKPQRILDMRQDGVVKAIKGVTSLEEVSRIIGLESLR